MEKARPTENENERLDAVKSTRLLDTQEESEFDNLSALCAKLTDSPISLITLIDEKRNWFKAHFGTELREDARERSFCGHAIHNASEPFIINNTKADKRFEDNPLVTGETQIRFYAGVPIVDEKGFALGTLCIMDHKAKKLTEDQVENLIGLARQASILMMHHKKSYQLKRLNDELIETNNNLSHFAKIAAHDLKSPVVSISEMVKLYKNKFGSEMNEKQNKMLNLIAESSVQLKSMIEGTLNHSKSASILARKKKDLLLNDLVDQAKVLVDKDKNHDIKVHSEEAIFRSNEVAIKRILINLFSNSIKYNDKEQSIIRVGLKKTETNYILSVRDNGPGIHLDFQDKVFQIFERGDQSESKIEGIGIGLATVKKLVEGMEGDIQITNGEKEGVVFTIKLPL